jgi:penicillin-binding protein 2
LRTKIFIYSSIVVITVFVFLINLYRIQVVDSEYKISAENNAFRKEIQYPARGVIFDRNGKLLVYNEPSYDLLVVPGTIGKFDTVEFCKIFQIDKKNINEIFSKHYNKYRPAIIEKQIPNSKFAFYEENLYKFPGFYIEKRTLRTYPKPIGAHLLGYVGEVNKIEIENDPFYSMGDYIGKSGLERTYDKYIRGEKGVKILVVDVKGKIQGSYKNGKYDIKAISGKNVTTTIDADIQEYGESLMVNKIGAVVAIEPATGEILAFISSPGYDPNLFIGNNLSKNYREIENAPNKPLYNRAIKSRYPPGSTFKPVSALIALQERVIFENTVFIISGGYNAGNHVVKDHVSGSVNLVASIQMSSNAYYCNVFKKIISDDKFKSAAEAYENWRNHLNKFGLGLKLGTDLAYEDQGLIFPSTYFDKIYGKGRWNHNTIISLAIGQGELGFTPLQIANMTAAIANRGFYIIPHVIRSIADEKENQIYKTKHYTGISPEYFIPVIDGMEKVVTGGTATIANLPGISICGKTGTAQNPHGEDHSIFIAFAPKENPKIAIAVYIENAGFGSTWAAPVASLMIEKYLTDSISRPWLEKRIVDGNLLNVIKRK